MAEIKSLMMDSLSKVQSNNQVQMKKDKNANDFANCLSASKNGNTANTANTANTKNSVSDNQKSSNLKVAKSNTVNAKNTDDNISELNANTSVKADLKSVENVANEITNEITNEVRDILGVDDETLANAMTALGFSALDLLDTSNLAKLVLTINGSSEFTDLLTDENMMNQLNSLIDVVENINWEELTGMSKEDFATALANSMQQSDIEDENLMTTVSDGETFSVVQEDTPDRQVNVQTDVSDNMTDAKQDVTVVVEKNQNEAEPGSAQTDSDAGKNMSEEIAESTVSDDDAVSSRQTNVQNNFIQNMEQAAVNVEQTQSARPDTVRMQQMVDIVNQVVEKIKVSLGTESTSMEMQLNPEHLGKVLLNVSSKNGMMTAVFSVQSEEAKAALESQMFTLRENLELRELKVDAVEVNVSDFDFSRSDQAMDGGQSKADDGNGKQMKFDFGDDSSDESAISNEEKEAVRKQVMRDNGSQIDFTA